MRLCFSDRLNDYLGSIITELHKEIQSLKAKPNTCLHTDQTAMNQLININACLLQVAHISRPVNYNKRQEPRQFVHKICSLADLCNVGDYNIRMIYIIVTINLYVTVTIFP